MFFYLVESQTHYNLSFFIIMALFSRTKLKAKFLMYTSLIIYLFIKRILILFIKFLELAKLGTLKF